jgi:hypothetical protein
MGINIVLTLLTGSIKNPTSKKKYRRAMLKIYNAIKTTFADDEEFQ